MALSSSRSTPSLVSRSSRVFRSQNSNKPSKDGDYICTQLGTQILLPIMALVLHLVNSEIVPDCIYIKASKVHPENKTMLSYPKCIRRIILDFNEIYELSWEKRWNIDGILNITYIMQRKFNIYVAMGNRKRDKSPIIYCNCAAYVNL